MREDAWLLEQVRASIREVFPEAAVALSDDWRWHYSDLESLEALQEEPPFGERGVLPLELPNGQFDSPERESGDLSGGFDHDLADEDDAFPITAGSVLNVVYGVDTRGRAALVPHDYYQRFGAPSGWELMDYLSEPDPSFDPRSDPPIDSVPIQHRINIDWAVQEIRERFPMSQFYERGDLKVLSCDLGMLLEDSGHLRHMSAEEFDLWIGDDDEPWYIDQLGRRARESAIREAVEEITRQERLRSLSVGQLISLLVDQVLNRANGLIHSNFGDQMDEEREIAGLVRQQMPFIQTVLGGYQTVDELIAAGESKNVEFKSTSRVDLREGRRSADIEDSAVKTVAAFLNADGGTLLIGVTDEGLVGGLDTDLSLFGGSTDRYLNWLNGLMVNALGDAAASRVRTTIESTTRSTGGLVCRVDVDPSDVAVFSKMSSGSQRFHVRIGNSTRALDPQEQHRYTRDRFPRSS